jgi:transposase
MITTVCDRTNSENVIRFLEKFIEYQQARGIDLANTIIITDNHRSHHSVLTQTFLNRSGLRMMFLPKYSSILSPVERFWSMFK